MAKTDIVEMLRTPTGSCPPTKWELAAAKEIERLRRKLAKKLDQEFARVRREGWPRQS